MIWRDGKGLAGQTTSIIGFIASLCERRKTNKLIIMQTDRGVASGVHDSHIVDSSTLTSASSPEVFFSWLRTFIVLQ